MSDPDKGFWQYRYDVLGQLQCQQDAKGQLTVYAYDVLGRETERRHYSGTGSNNLATCTSTKPVNATFTWTYDNAAGTGTTRGQLTADSANHNGFVQSRSYQYDDFGRLIGVSTSMDDQTTWAEKTTYDEFGRLFQQFDAAGDELGAPLGVRYVYNDDGHLTELREAAGGSLAKTYVTYRDQDARGQISQTRYGNDQVTDRLFDARTGLIQWIGTGSATTPGVQNLSYQWDLIGNLKQRHDQTPGRDQREDFDYDGLNRLATVKFTGLGQTNPVTTLSLGYNAAGNIASKTGVGNYTYGTKPTACNQAGEDTPGPHAVSATTSGSLSYCYDINGNQVRDTSGRTFTYTAFERLFQATKGSDWSRYFYAPDLNWVKRETQGTDAGNPLSETLWRIGNVEISQKGNIRELRRTIGGEVQVSHWSTNPFPQAKYLHKDHIGSIDAITDDNGQVVEGMSFTAFGERREIANWTVGESLVTALREITSKGFTGHEMVDAVGIIHMGGRIYDPKLGRFLQADPFVQAPDNSQNLNRYSYVLNNPLSYTDPSGFFFGKLFKRIIKREVKLLKKAIGEFFINLLPDALANNPFIRFAIQHAVQFISGAVQSAFNKNPLQFTSLPSDSAGIGLDPSAFRIIEGPRDGDLLDSQIADQRDRTRVAVLGGTASEITGNKFANGALSTAFDFALGFIPGVDLVRALTDPNATKLDVALGVLSLIPGQGKLAALGIKGAKKVFDFAKIFRRGKVTRGKTLRRFVRQDEFSQIQGAINSGGDVRLGRFFTPDDITDARVATS